MAVQIYRPATGMSAEFSVAGVGLLCLWSFLVIFCYLIPKVWLFSRTRVTPEEEASETQGVGGSGDRPSFADYSVESGWLHGCSSAHMRNPQSTILSNFLL